MRQAGLLVAVLLVSIGLVCAGEGGGADPAPAQSKPVEQRDSAVDAAPKTMETAAPGGVVKDMSAVEVLAARGAPIRKEAIPPDAELWYYPEGEVAFTGGKVSYVGLNEPQARGATPHQERLDELPKKFVEPQVPEASRRSDAARVHAPGDGFLALRSDPTVRRGKRLLKIPHGARLTLDECIAHSNDGRWCRTTFRGKTGWVFDQYLVR